MGMQYEEVKPIFEKMSAKKAEADRLLTLKKAVTRATNANNDPLTVTVEGQPLKVLPNDIHALIDSQIQANDITSDLADLKNKAK